MDMLYIYAKAYLLYISVSSGRKRAICRGDFTDEEMGRGGNASQRTPLGCKMPYHVCHKCGLPREVTEPDKVDLGSCDCLGQTRFEAEDTPHTRDEAIQLGVGRFLDYLVLYMRQGRDTYDFRNLIEKYKKVLAYRAVYKVVINE